MVDECCDRRFHPSATDARSLALNSSTVHEALQTPKGLTVAAASYPGFADEVHCCCLLLTAELGLTP